MTSPRLSILTHTLHMPSKFYPHSRAFTCHLHALALQLSASNCCTPDDGSLTSRLPTFDPLSHVQGTAYVVPQFAIFVCAECSGRQ